MLEKYMGRDTFRMAIREFVNVWQYKHPTPYDLFSVLKKSTPHQLDWFIDQWFYQAGWADLSIGEVRLSGNTLKAEINKKGAFAVPIIVELEFIDGAKETMQWKPDVWKSKNSIIVTLIITDEIKAIRLGNSSIPDKNRNDNYFEISD
jgi:aminopeptidase N